MGKANGWQMLSSQWKSLVSKSTETHLRSQPFNSRTSGWSGFSENRAWDSHPTCVYVRARGVGVEVAENISSPAVVMVTAWAGQAGDTANHVGLTFLWVSRLSGSWGKTATTASLWLPGHAERREAERRREAGQLAAEGEERVSQSHLETGRGRGARAQARTHAHTAWGRHRDSHHELTCGGHQTSFLEVQPALQPPAASRWPQLRQTYRCQDEVSTGVLLIP
ncbi:uncharacterized protein LOC119866871 [Canis lupus familiaris]|uniref:uncharacterized protein LOC119866871 n=1 Tax=Canis lupus familiaris TaxID=9615 RepID=UPI0018F63095|nr:uncharacterized protein LOC119866871 [Canis lupus familiaris]XP_038317246.1 uncharacterized protein LOC119866871 [Canis lupus familiaris]